MIKQKDAVFYFLTFFLTHLPAQQIVNQFDKQGLRHGVWQKNFPNTNQLRYSGQFYHGKEIDTFRFYKLLNGKSVLSAIKVFHHTNTNSDVIFFSSKQNLISKGTMHGKHFVGKWVYYHENSDILMSIEHYNSKGVLEGLKEVYYRTGTVAEVSHYKNGIRHGISKWFSEQGVLLRTSHYSAGQLNGNTVYYTNEGIIKSEGNYTNNLKSGVWTHYKGGKVAKTTTH